MDKYNAFYKMTPEQQAKWIENHTKTLLKRLPKLKKELQRANDKSGEIYTSSPEEIMLMGDVYSKQARKKGISRTGFSSSGARVFIEDLVKYARGSISQLVTDTARTRWNSYIEHVNSVSDSKEQEYFNELVKKMEETGKETFDKLILGFTRSDYFLDTGDYGSSDWVKFRNDFGYNVNIIKLENYLDEKGFNTKRIYRQIMDYNDEFKVQSTRRGSKTYKNAKN